MYTEIARCVPVFKIGKTLADDLQWLVVWPTQSFTRALQLYVLQGAPALDYGLYFLDSLLLSHKSRSSLRSLYSQFLMRGCEM